MKNVVKLKTSDWLAEIAVENGGNIYRLLHRNSGIEVLRTPPDLSELRAHPVRYGIPVLFPPNRIDQGKFVWFGLRYELPLNEPERNNHLHGLILGQPWELKEVSNNSITMSHEYAATPGFPHDFTLTMSYKLSVDKVDQKFTVRNNSNLPMPFGLGFHTAFNMPSGACTEITAGAGYWEIIRPRCLPSGKLQPWRKGVKVFRDDQAVSCHCPLETEIINGQPFRGMIMHYPDKKAKLLYKLDEHYRHWCLWNGGGGQGFFCAEPMTWMVNAPNLDIPVTETGLQVLQPDQSWTGTATLQVFIW